MAALMENTLLPDPGDVERTGAINALLSLLVDESKTELTGPSGAVAPLPDEVRSVLLTVVRALASGSAVTVEPRRTVLTTQEAAEILSVSRPTLVRLLEGGQIPYTTPGRHRRVELAEVLKYQQRLRKDRNAALADLGHSAPDGTDVGFVATR
ncbi:helix-turn-helix domain-containing protein [Antrihabitans spumae]|uniref:Helix-turn-helix domain-containing protein n=1 Tax=Antrihabitans spumae TaxID=3373370 RepID=A0ABW7JKZ1_9NOCA